MLIRSERVLLLWILSLTQILAAQRAGDPVEIARRLSSGQTEAAAEIERLMDPLLARKDVWSLDETSGAREAAKILGAGIPQTAVHWFVLPQEGSNLRLMTIDFGTLIQPVGDGRNGYVAYGIVEGHEGGAPNVSWYHDLGRKLSEQGGEPWHPLGVTPLVSSGGTVQATLAVAASGRVGGSPSGLLLLEQKSGVWAAARRIAPGPGAHLLGAAPDGIVFLMGRTPPKGVLTGAPPELFRSLVLYERTADGYAAEPIVAAIPDVVSATEAVMATLRRGDKDEARRLCTSSDVVEALLYFSPGWKGGGKVVRTGQAMLEIVYEEKDRPTLRIEFTYQNRAGNLLLASATGRAETAKP